MALPPNLDDDLARIRRRKSEATAKGGQAAPRPLRLAEHHDSGQATRIAGFIASTYHGQVFPFVLDELCTLDEAIADDMLLCIDALRWAQADLHTLVPDGDRRRATNDGGAGAARTEVAKEL